jgi:hypothetical protein
MRKFRRPARLHCLAGFPRFFAEAYLRTEKEENDDWELFLAAPARSSLPLMITLWYCEALIDWN